VQTALDDLKVQRVDHGNRALDDAALTARLVRDQTPLTMCPLSNLRLRGIPSLAQSPVKIALDAGLLVSVNSDDPSYFGGYLNDNYRAVHEALELDDHHIITLAKNSFASAFISDKEKQQAMDKVDSVARKLSTK